jgi:hypothetical protein
MKLTAERLIELGWEEGNFNGHMFMFRNGNVLLNMAGVWALGILHNGQPFIPFSNPMYVTTEKELNELIR